MKFSWEYGFYFVWPLVYTYLVSLVLKKEKILGSWEVNASDFTNTGTDTFLRFSGLNANTTYRFIVKSKCSNGGTSIGGENRGTGKTYTEITSLQANRIATHLQAFPNPSSGVVRFTEDVEVLNMLGEQIAIVMVGEVFVYPQSGMYYAVSLQTAEKVAFVVQ